MYLVIIFTEKKHKGKIIIRFQVVPCRYELFGLDVKRYEGDRAEQVANVDLITQSGWLQAGQISQQLPSPNVFWLNSSD